VARVMSATGPSPRRSDRAYRDEIRQGATTKGAGRCRHHPLGGGQKAAPPRWVFDLVIGLLLGFLSTCSGFVTRTGLFQVISRLFQGQIRGTVGK
jgi:hypothetical protein